MNETVTSLIEVPELVEKRRGQIVAAATELFSSQGFYRTTIKDIARLAGISSGLVYQYVREKEDVLLLVLLEVVDSYAREIPAAIVGIDDPLERLVTAVRAYCRVVDRHRAATVLAYRSTKSLSPKRRELIQQRETDTNDIIRRTLVDCMERGIIRKANVDALTYQIVLTAHGWALKSWYFKSRLSLEDYIEANLDTLLNGILTEVGKERYSDLDAS
ncbi:MAG: TetR family transcriptional regulator [Aquamicrobium sp.]|nr:TetR family transcriptional regulator [Aquamicrobium sp.]